MRYHVNVQLTAAQPGHNKNQRKLLQRYMYFINFNLKIKATIGISHDNLLVWLGGVIYVISIAPTR